MFSGSSSRGRPREVRGQVHSATRNDIDGSEAAELRTLPSEGYIDSGQGPITDVLQNGVQLGIVGLDAGTNMLFQLDRLFAGLLKRETHFATLADAFIARSKAGYTLFPRCAGRARMLLFTHGDHRRDGRVGAIIDGRWAGGIPRMGVCQGGAH